MRQVFLGYTETNLNNELDNIRRIAYNNNFNIIPALIKLRFSKIVF